MPRSLLAMRGKMMLSAPGNAVLEHAIRIGAFNGAV